jgi:hypothetical protein
MMVFPGGQPDARPRMLADNRCCLTTPPPARPCRNTRATGKPSNARPWPAVPQTVAPASSQARTPVAVSSITRQRVGSAPQGGQPEERRAQA